MSSSDDVIACIKGISQIEDIITNLKRDKGLLQIALDDKTTLLKSCEAALEERDKVPRKLAENFLALKLSARKLAIEADEFQEGEGDGMKLADAITEVERLTS